MANGPILSSILQPAWRSERSVLVELYPDSLVLRSPSQSNDILERINLNLVFGCHLMQVRPRADAVAFSLYAYPFHKKCCNCKPVPGRYRQVYTFNVASSTAPNGAPKAEAATAAELALGWVNAISHLLEAPPAPQKPLDSRPPSADILRRPRRLLVLINPHSGPGNALRIFDRSVMPVFAEANILVHLVITERANHAREVVEKLDLQEFDGIVIVSGDGLIYEVVNGLASRADRLDALRMPLGVVAGGSGNALAASILFVCGETFPTDMAQQNALHVARPLYTPLRLLHVETPRRHLISFMSLSWGLLGDIDMETEKLRRTLGGARFTAGAWWRTLILRKYRGRLSFIRAEPSMTTPTPNGSDATTSLPPIRTGRGSGSNGAMENAPQSLSDALRSHDVVEMTPILSRKAGTKWEVLEDEFILVYASALPYISYDLPYTPAAKLDEDWVYLTVVRARRVNKLRLARLLLSIESRAHLKLSYFEVIPVRAFRLEPLSAKPGVIVVDGELIAEGGPVQMSVTRLAATVMCGHDARHLPVVKAK